MDAGQPKAKIEGDQFPPNGESCSRIDSTNESRADAPFPGRWALVISMALKHLILGKPRDIHDPHLFHKVSLIAFLAWVGLGADGLSSSAYGPDEAFRALGGHPELAIFLTLAMAVTVLIISLAYSRLIEHFPHGGGGYVVATKLLSPTFGVISGAALLVDYVLTITVSVASAFDQIYSFLPLHWQTTKIIIEAVAIVGLVLMNLRGVKESVTLIVPIFLLFVATHVVVLVGCVFVFWHNIPAIASHANTCLQSDVKSIGLWGLFLILMNAYSRGAGTYTGIEAVSNGVPIMREPKVRTAKKTMLYMAVSLAVTAGGILLCYMLAGVAPEEGKTLNATLVERLGFGQWFVVLTLLAEGGLLVVAAQTGFIDGPRVMSNMALDGWLPRRFGSLSEQLTMSQGVMLIGGAALVSLFYTHGDITTLVTMYSINVFVTFSLSQFGMLRFWWQKRKEGGPLLQSLALHGVAFVLCFGILVMVILEKFSQGAWMTVVVTSVVIGICFLIRRHYAAIHAQLVKLSETLSDLPGEAGAESDETETEPQPLNPKKATAVLLVASYSGLGIHSLLTILKMFPGHYEQIIFASIGVIDAGAFKGEEDLHLLEKATKDGLKKYEKLARGFGLAASSRFEIGTDPVDASEAICKHITKEYPKAVIFGGNLVFQRETFVQRILHNQTAHAIQRRLQWDGIPMMIMPIRVRES